VLDKEEGRTYVARVREFPRLEARRQLRRGPARAQEYGLRRSEGDVRLRCGDARTGRREERRQGVTQDKEEKMVRDALQSETLG
jgi:hypothetical protein